MAYFGAMVWCFLAIYIISNTQMAAIEVQTLGAGWQPPACSGHLLLAAETQKSSALLISTTGTTVSCSVTQTVRTPESYIAPTCTLTLHSFADCSYRTFKTDPAPFSCRS